ncbi:MAG: hypothetical protein SF162_11640 [bacterium]|nr:hypothetical protein [bacterium]
MAYISALRLPGEPIILVRYEGTVTVEDIHAATPEVDRLLHELGGTLYLIIDAAQATSNFQQMIAILRTPSALLIAEPGRIVPPDLKVHMLLVNNSGMAKLYSSAINQVQFGQLKVPLFRTLEDALTAARTAIAQQIAAS